MSSKVSQPLFYLIMVLQSMTNVMFVWKNASIWIIKWALLWKYYLDSLKYLKGIYIFFDLIWFDLGIYFEHQRKEKKHTVKDKKIVQTCSDRSGKKLKLTKSLLPAPASDCIPLPSRTFPPSFLLTSIRKEHLLLCKGLWREQVYCKNMEFIFILNPERSLHIYHFY